MKKHHSSTAKRRAIVFALTHAPFWGLCEGANSKFPQSNDTAVQKRNFEQVVGTNAQPCSLNFPSYTLPPPLEAWKTPFVACKAPSSTRQKGCACRIRPCHFTLLSSWYYIEGLRYPTALGAGFRVSMSHCSMMGTRAGSGRVEPRHGKMVKTLNCGERSLVTRGGIVTGQSWSEHRLRKDGASHVWMVSWLLKALRSPGAVVSITGGRRSRPGGVFHDAKRRWKPHKLVLF